MIQIASLVSVHGQTEPAVKNIITLNTCSSIIGAEVPVCAATHHTLDRPCPASNSVRSGPAIIPTASSPMYSLDCAAPFVRVKISPFLVCTR